MNSWKPISIYELNMEIENGLKKMTQVQVDYWQKISIKPEKWIEKEFGKEGGGFWVVAIIGDLAVWYNDIEEGFNISTFSTYGEISGYKAEQDELQWTINKLKRHHNTM
ncbi:MAG: hypothetical protein MI810_02190 [Flavobacteriales bacterium]|nr:hypothetical protein [Flavobacteriales bacterium]